MIDYILIKNSKIKLDVSNFGEYYNESKKKDGSKNHKYKIYKKDLSVFEVEDEDELRDYTLYDSYLILTVNTIKGFEIRGSIRRWWYSSVSANADLNYSSFCKCVKLLAKKIGVKENDLWNSNVSVVEIGGNLTLKPKFKNIIGVFESYKGRNRFGDRRYSVYFQVKNNAEEIILYDKIIQLYRREKKINGNVKNKLLKNVFILRFEVRINTPSKSRYKEYINPLRGIKENWELLIDNWEHTFKSITIIDQSPPTIPKDKKCLNRTDLKNYFMQLGIQTYGGIESVEKLVMETVHHTKTDDEKKFFRGIANSNISDKFAKFILELFTVVEGKAEEMKRGLL